MAGRQQVCVTLDEHDAGPAALLFEPDQMLVKRIVPGGPSVAQSVRCEFGIEAGTSQRARPARLDLPTIAPLAINVGVSLRTEKHRTLAMRQIGERGDHARRQLCIPPLASLRAPEDRASTDEINVTPIELHRLGHTGPCSDQKSEQRPQMRSGSSDQ